MTFKVGDRVTVKGWETSTKGNYSWEGRTGTVYDADNQDAVCVKFDDRQGTNFNRGGFEAKYLVPAVKPYTFEDIQVGDKIRRTLTRDTGTTEVREGTVVEKSSLYALDAKDTGRVGDSYILAYDSDGDPAKPQVKLELLDRPKPEPKLWENREAGDKIVSYDKQGNLDRLFTKREDGQWGTLVVNDNGKLQKGFERSDGEIDRYISKYANGNKFELVK